MTDLLDAKPNARLAPPARPAGITGGPEFDKAAAGDVPLAAAALPGLPPPTMNTTGHPILTPEPSTPLPPALTPILTLTPIPTSAPAPAPGRARSVKPQIDAASGSAADAAPGLFADADVPDSSLDEPSPSLVAEPAAILSIHPAFAPLGPTSPDLPATSTAKVAPAPPAAPLTLEDLFGQQLANGPAKKKLGSFVRRSARRLAILGVLAAGGFAAFQYGPGLYNEYIENEPAAQEPKETDAPLAFPDPAPPSAPIRTAEFILEGLPGAPDMTYYVTTDFETNVSQVDVTRPTGPDLQILTYGESALIRNVDADQWYQLERGRFPLDDRLERADWVRQLDELLPTTIRSSVTIDDAGETSVSGVPTRRLSLSLDVALLGGTVPAPDASADSATGPVTSLATSIEVWVDAEGLVRKVSGIPQLGAETITVVRTDGAAWVPNYPAPEFVQPLTAATLVELGI